MKSATSVEGVSTTTHPFSTASSVEAEEIKRGAEDIVILNGDIKTSGKTPIVSINNTGEREGATSPRGQVNNFVLIVIFFI